MKSFDKLEPLAVGEVLTFLGSKSRRTLSGVCDRPVRVMVQQEDRKPVLFHAFGLGQFSFEMASRQGFNLWFESDDAEAVVSLIVPPHSTVLVGDPERMFTKVDFRPAMDPALRAIQQELAALRGQVRRFKAPPAPHFKEPDKAPAVDAEAVVEPVVETTVHVAGDADVEPDPKGVTK